MSRTVSRAGLAVATAVLLFFAVGVGTAQAEWWFTKQGAQRIAKEWVQNHYDYEYDGLQAYCRPQGMRKGNSRYKYHRWVCGWAGGAMSNEGEDLVCAGQVRIIGSRDVGAYYAKATRGERCTPS